VFQLEFKNCVKLFNSGNILDSKSKAELLLEKYPDNFELNKFLGVLFFYSNNLIEAKIFFNKCLEINPKASDIYFNLGLVFKKDGQPDTAKKNYEAAINLDQNFLKAYINLGVVLEEQNKYFDAIKILDLALKRDNKNYAIYSNRGILFQKIKKFEDSVASFIEAIKINNSDSEIFYNLAITYRKMGDFDNAIINYKKAISLNPNHYRAYNNLGSLFVDLRRFPEALEFFKKTLEINKEFLEANYNASFIFLLQNQFIEGWQRYENRWHVKEGGKPLYDLSNNFWDGKFLEGTLLVWSEQGIGDHIFFGRLVKTLKDYAKNIIFAVDIRLADLFKNFFLNMGIDNISVIKLIKDDIQIKFDKHIPAGSLPRYFAKNDNDILKFSKDIFIIDRNDNKKLNNFLENLPGFKIGLSWKSLNNNEQHRSIPLQSFNSILKTSNCSFVNLQFGNIDEELNQAQKNLGVKIHDLKEIDKTNDINELAFLIKNLDLIITIQNTTAHLSLGFQKKTFVLLPTNSRWQWGVNSKTSVWYPSAQLFRQTRFNYWEDVLNNVKNELNKLLI
jgi:tetratricopeptide (TPR) repeat protein/ADP-heptose:LPS heptosyltransferase